LRTPRSTAQPLNRSTARRARQERTPPSKLSRFPFETRQGGVEVICDRLIQHVAERAKREPEQLTPVPGDTELQCPVPKRTAGTNAQRSSATNGAVCSS